MKVEHAPGPWTLKEREDCPGYRIEDADGCLVEYVNESRYVDGREDPEHMASLHAMTAAPTMLKALERADALIENLWKAVPWGQTADLDIAALNEVPGEIKRAIVAAKGDA